MHESVPSHVLCNAFAGGNAVAVRSVLIVDDDSGMAETLADILSVFGYAVTTASSAVTAVRMVTQTRPDLVLMDVTLPGIDGIEATEKLRGARATAAIPVAVLSAQAFGDNVERARQAGCVDYLTKPIGARELLERVGSLVGKNGNPRSPKRERKRR